MKFQISLQTSNPIQLLCWTWNRISQHEGAQWVKLYKCPTYHKCSWINCLLRSLQSTFLQRLPLGQFFIASVLRNMCPEPNTSCVCQSINHHSFRNIIDFIRICQKRFGRKFCCFGTARKNTYTMTIACYCSHGRDNSRMACEK